MGAFDYQLSTITKYRAGTISDPFIDVTQSDVVNQQRIVLNEIPTFLNKLQISGMVEVFDVDTADLTSTQFRVDYNEGLVFFHSSLEGVTKTILYKGRGNHYISATRVYTQNSGDNITQTLDSIVAAASQFVFIGDYNSATNYKSYNIVNYQGSSYMYINVTSASGHLPTDLVYWARISGSVFRGQYSTSTSYNSGDTISDSNNYKIYQSLVSSNLNQALTDTTKWQLLIDVSSVVASANTATNNANIATSSANTATTNASNATTAANTAKTNADTATVAANTATGNANTATTNANNAATAANNLVTTFVAKGAYNAGTAYVVNNTVSYNGSSWRCILNSTNNTPVEGTYWTLIASKGADGAGTVAGITSTNADIAVGGTSANPTLTLNAGTGANQIVKRDGSGNLNATTVTTNANLTGDITSVGNATSIAPNVIVNADINASAAIDATKIANGTVTNTEFQYLGGVTSAIQTQITARANEIGILSGLTTTNKILVPAINEVQTMPTNSMSRQAIINGNFDVWQRGTSWTNAGNGTYTSDRWQFYLANTGTLPTSLIHSQQVLVSGDIPNSYFYYRLNTNGSGSGFAAGDVNQLLQKIENGTRYLCGAGKKITVSFWARSSIAGKRLGISLQNQYGSGGSPTSPENINGTTFTLTSNWTKYTFTFTTNTLVGKTFGTNNDDFLSVFFGFMWGSTYIPVFNSGTSETFGGSGNIDIAQVQVNAGDQALPFQPRSFAEELALCQRYYEKSYDYLNPPGSNTGNGVFSYKTRDSIAASTAGGLILGLIAYKVKKRVTPTVITYGTTSGTGFCVRVNTSADRAGITAGFSGESGFSSVNVNNSSPTVITADSNIDFHWTADAEL